ncbi:hypothetical protein DICPUDRAFT_23823, partial [Dictyostelium purpureum]
NMDRLFYKVFHNTYLFKTILGFIQEVEWVNYDDPSQITSSNRYRFKDIVSLKWMVQNKMFSLLKCKLEANEYICMD